MASRTRGHTMGEGHAPHRLALFLVSLLLVPLLLRYTIGNSLRGFTICTVASELFAKAEQS